MFYEQLKKECEKQHLKMTPLIIECGGTNSSATHWKNGAIPKSDIVLKLAKRLGVSTDYLLGNTPATNISTGDINNSVVASVNSALNIGVNLNDVEQEIIKVCKRLELKEQVDILRYAYKVEEGKHHNGQA